MAYRSKHIPGPWQFRPFSNNGVKILGSDGSEIVSRVIGFKWAGTHHEANLRLMCAAPEMLEALKLCFKELNRVLPFDEYGNELIDAVREAIDKAQINTQDYV